MKQILYILKHLYNKTKVYPLCCSGTLRETDETRTDHESFHKC